MDTKLRSSGITELGEMPWGTHFCLFYETKEDLLDTLVPYLKAGLEGNEFCMWVIADALTEADAWRALGQAVPDLERYRSNQSIELIQARDWYLNVGHFELDRIMSVWNRKLTQALARGHAGMRVSGDTLWLEKKTLQSFLEYEDQLDESITDQLMTVLCTYPLISSGAAEILDVARKHQFALARRSGALEVIETSELKHAKADITRLNADLGRRVEERTVQLAATNEELRQEISERKHAEEALVASEARLQAAIDAADVGLWDWDLVSGKIIWLGHHEKLFGFAPGEFDGTYSSFEKRIHPEDLQELNSVVQRARTDGSEYLHEYRVIWPDGSLRWIAGRGKFVYNEIGQPVRMYGAVLDITVRHRVEDTLRRSESNFRTLVDKSLQGIAIFQDQKIIYANPAQSALLGYTIKELKSMSAEQLIALVHPLDRDTTEERVRKRMAGEELSQFIELRILRKDSSSRWIQSFNNLIEYNEQPAILTASIDITERKRAEEAIRKSEQVLREAESLGHTGSWEQDLVTGEIFNTEENLRLFFGDDCSKGTPFDDYAQAVHPDDREFVMQQHAQLLEGGPGDIEFRVVWPDGSVHVLFGRATVVRDELGQAIRVYGTNVDITERRRTEDAARESEKLLHLVLDTLPVGVAVTDPADNIIVANPASKRIWGDMIISGSERREKSIGFWHDSGKRIAPEEWASLRALSKGETSLNELIDIETFDGVHKIIRNSSAPIRNSEGIIVGAVFVNEDVTERKRAEEETKHQAARAETLARIAARLNKQLDLESVIHAVCQEAVDTFKVSQAIISLYDKKRDLLDYAGGVNIPPQYGAKIESVSRAQFEESDRTMGPILVVPDIQARPNANVPSTEFTFELNVRTVVTADMRRDQELIGVLVLGVNGQVREFDPDELTLLKAISDQAAIAVANALLLKEANEQHEQLRSLSAKLVEVQESERKRLAREIHDDISQTLTASIMQLGTAKSLLPKSAKSAHTILEQTEELIENTLEQTRSIIADLRPQVLDDLGLVPALRRLGHELQESSGGAVKIKTSRLPKRLPAAIEVTLFRIVQAALANVRQHAQARHVTISLVKEPERVVLTVQDDGVGFEMQTTRSRQSGDMVIDGGLVIKADHFGLIGIQERVAQLGGIWEVMSAPGQGTTLRVELPL